MSLDVLPLAPEKVGRYSDEPIQPTYPLHPGQDEPPLWQDAPNEACRQHDPVDKPTILANQYILEKRIAVGGMSEMWRALDCRMVESHAPNPYVAVKIITRQTDGEGNGNEIDALYREWRCLKDISHPNIIRHHNIGSEGERIFLVMDYLIGPTLAELIHSRSGRGIPEQRACGWIQQIGTTLAWAHKQGIVHVDFKPSNVKIMNGMQPILLDFGLSYNAANTIRVPSDALTPAYASPEMFTGRLPSVADDVFSFACVVYELLAGRHPYHRLPSPQALRLGATPDPIPSLSWSRWRALAAGLALHRHDRNISIEQLTRKLTEHINPSARRRGILQTIGMFS